MDRKIEAQRRIYARALSVMKDLIEIEMKRVDEDDFAPSNAIADHCFLVIKESHYLRGLLGEKNI